MNNLKSSLKTKARTPFSIYALLFLMSLGLLVSLESCRIIAFTAPTEAAIGDDIDLYCEVRHNGSQTVSNAFVKFHASYDRYLDDSDLLLFSSELFEMKSGETIPFKTTVSITDNVVSGKYFLIASTLIDTYVREIEITGQPIEGPDLVPINFLWGNEDGLSLNYMPKTMALSDITPFYYSVKNRGNQLAENVKTTCYISDNKQLDEDDIVIGVHSYSSIDEGVSEHGVGKIYFDTDKISVGRKYLILKTDANNEVAEADEYNNLLIELIEITDGLSSGDLDKNAFGEVSKSLEDLPIEDIITVYPNPSEGQFNISINALEGTDNQVDIYNMKGQLMQTINAINSFAQEVNLNDFPAGLYIAKVKIKDKVYTKKLMINR